jgi:single-strand DNA-binding protein
MARSFNQVTLMGNLTRDPELRQTPNGHSVCSFSLALNRSYKDQSGEWQEMTDFVDIVCWAALAERVAQYLSKGRPALVSGRLQSSSWEQDGKKRSKVEVVANDVTFLGGGRASDDNNGSAGASQASESKPAKPPAEKTKKKDKDVKIEDVDDEPINLDDIPF